MNTKLTYMMAQHRSAELRHSGERARLASAAGAQRRQLRDRLDRNPTTRVSTQPGQGSPRGMSAPGVAVAIGSER
jgi:hypothetical protein